MVKGTNELPEDLKNFCAADYGADAFLVIDRDEALFLFVCLLLLGWAFA